MDENSRKQSTARRDLFIAVVAALGAFALAASFDLNENWMEWVVAHEIWEIDEIPIALALASLGFGWYAYRLKQEHSREVQLRAVAHERLTREISERKQVEATLREREVRLRQAVQTAKLGHWVWCLDTDQLVYSSEKNSKIIGSTGDPTLNFERFIGSVVPEDRVNVIRRWQETVKSQKPFVAEYRFRGADGEVRHLSEMAEYFSDNNGGLGRIVGTTQDITKRKQVEEELRLAKEAAEDANRAKSDFLATMGHELRTPLNAVLGFSEMLRNQVFGPIGSERYIGYADDIHASGTHLLSIINDILDVSKLEAGKMELDEGDVDLHAVIEDYSRLVRPRAESENIQIKAIVPKALPLLRGDAQKIKQILINLLSNAVKFTSEHGVVRVEVTRHDDGGLVVAVHDNGIGMAPDDVVKALETFGQVDSSMGRKYEGTGFGLPLVRMMTELHGGTLTVDSELGVGTSVTVKFPPERTLSGLTAAA